MELPLFPLHVVLFPGRPLPLHIFEPRYRRLVEDLEAGDGCFGVVAIRNGHEVGGGAEYHEVGTVARLASVTRLPDGRAEILTRGAERFRVVRPLPDDPYPRGEVELLPERPPGPMTEELAAVVREALRPYLCGLGMPDELADRLPDDPAAFAWFVAASLQTELPEQQRLLELERTEERLAVALRLLRREQGLARHLGAVGSLRPPGPNGAQLN